MKPRTVVLILFLLLVITVAVATILVAGTILVLSGEGPSVLGGPKVALVRVENVLYDSGVWLEQLTVHGKDTSVRAVVIRVDSPGGLVGPSQELYRAVRNLRVKHKKIVVASFGSVAASGGYYVACAADKIVSAPGTLTGSIGVYMKFWQAQDLLEKIGVGSETVKAGDYKDFGGFDRKLTTDERDMLRSVVEDTYDQFVEAVREGRQERLVELLQSDPDEIRSTKRDADGKIKYPFSEKLLALIEEYNQAIPAKSIVEEPSKEVDNEVTSDSENGEVPSSTEAASADIGPATGAHKEQMLAVLRRAPPEVEKRLVEATVHQVADGKVYTGRQALEIGLVDQIGTLDDAIKLAAKLAGLKGEPHVIEKKPKRSFLLDWLLDSLAQGTTNRPYSPLQYRLPF